MTETASPPIERAGQKQYLTFLLGRERYAMPTGCVREVIGFSSLTEVPMMPGFLRGVVNVRGSVVPVIDLSLRLGLPETVFGKRTCVVILELVRGVDRMRVGLLVDVVQAVLGLDDERIGPRPGRGGPVHPDFIGNLLDLDGHDVAALDLSRVLDLDELAELIGRAGLGMGGGATHPDSRP